jgi:hypothetical protein
MSVLNISHSQLRQPFADTVPRGYCELLEYKPEVRTYDNPHKAHVLALTTRQCTARPGGGELIFFFFGTSVNADRGRIE